MRKVNIYFLFYLKYMEWYGALHSANMLFGRSFSNVASFSLPLLRSLDICQFSIWYGLVLLLASLQLDWRQCRSLLSFLKILISLPSPLGIIAMETSDLWRKEKKNRHRRYTKKEKKEGIKMHLFHSWQIFYFEAYPLNLLHFIE